MGFVARVRALCGSRFVTAKFCSTLPQHLFSPVQVNSGYVFAIFTPDDVNELCTIERTINPSPWSAENFLSSLRQHHLCLGIQRDDIWIAYGVCSRVLDEAEVLLVGVRKEYQGQGLGKVLMSGLLEMLKPLVKNVFLEVRASNEPAIALYHAVGFNCIGERPGYYPPFEKSSSREDALIFALEFTD